MLVLSDEAVGVLPAHAGMIPRLSSKTVGSLSAPRSCWVLLKTVWFMCMHLCVAMVCARRSFCADGSRVSAGRWRTVGVVRRQRVLLGLRNTP